MNNDLITIISLLIGLLGLVATLVGTYFTYISFVNPIKRFKKYLKNPENWEKFQGIENHLSFYRHKKYPNFQIVIDWDKELVENFHEERMNDALYPDKTNNASYYVRLANIVGIYHFGDKGIYDFAKSQSKPIGIRE